MPSDKTAGYSKLRRKGPDDLNTVALHGLDSDSSTLVSAQLGDETVKIVVGDCSSVLHRSCWRGSDRFVVHKLLLAQHSPFFNAKFNNFIERETIREITESIVSDTARFLGNSADVPQGYTSSIAASIQEWEEEMARRDDSEPSTVTAQEVLNLPSEDSGLFSVLVHWFYTQQLPSKTRHFDVDMLNSLVRLYMLAERLDVPELRRQCYRKIRTLYRINESISVLSEIAVTMAEASEASQLRKYMVSLVAHAIINKTDQGAVDLLLRTVPQLEREVSVEVLRRLRSEEGSVDPNQDVFYRDDDSESDYEVSGDEDDDSIDYDSDEYEAWSEDEEIDLQADGAELQASGDLGITEHALHGDPASEGSNRTVEETTAQPDLSIKAESEDEYARWGIKTERETTIGRRPS